MPVRTLSMMLSFGWVRFVRLLIGGLLVLGVSSTAEAEGSPARWDEFVRFITPLLPREGGVEAVYEYELSERRFVFAYHAGRGFWYTGINDALSGLDSAGGYSGRSETDDAHTRQNVMKGHVAAASMNGDRNFGFVLLRGLLDTPDLVDGVSHDAGSDTWTITYEADRGRRDYQLGLGPKGRSPRPVTCRVSIDGLGRMISYERVGGSVFRYDTFAEDSPDGFPVPVSVSKGSASLVSVRSLTVEDFDRRRVLSTLVEYDTSGQRRDRDEGNQIPLERREDGSVGLGGIHGWGSTGSGGGSTTSWMFVMGGVTALCAGVGFFWWWRRIRQ